MLPSATENEITRIAGLLVFSLLFLSGALALPVHGQETFMVNATGDAGDANVGDGNCATSGGSCTLRAAVEEANADADRDVIDFSNIPTTGGFATITPGSELQVTEGIFIDGTTAPNYSAPGPPIVVLDGNSISGAQDDGIDLEGSASGSTIYALGIVNFPDDGIEANVGVSGVTIGGCYVGIDVDGNAAKPNGWNPDSDGGNGMNISSDNNSIGTLFTPNIVSGNTDDGIVIRGSGNAVANNLVGTSDDGTADVGNGGYGIRVEGSNNQVGQVSSFFGSLIDNGNVVSGNDGGGIYLGADGQTVIANYVGTTSDGLSALGNQGNGIQVRSSNNTIGPDSRGIGSNVVAASQYNGISLGSAGNIPVEASNNVVKNNLVGVDKDAASALGNGSGGADAGVRIDSGEKNEILDNIIAGNNNQGLSIRADATLGTGSIARGNFIGTNESFDDLGNGDNGVYISGSYISIGGSSSEAGNVIAFNGTDGVKISGGNSNILRGNYIGTNADGDDLGNTDDGVHFQNGATDNRLALTYGDNSSFSSRANDIAFNGGNGVNVTGASTAGNAIRGNRIYRNAGLGIDLGNDGQSAKDFGDGDDGPNKLINSPEIDQEQTQYDEDSGEVQVRYKVDCNNTDCNYGSNGLKVDFYTADSEGSGQGATYIGTLYYPEASATSYRNDTFSPVNSIGRTDVIVATATDADANTSEFTGTAASLPIELVSLTARMEGEGVALQWKTASEENNAGFEVEHKVDGAFEQIGYREGAGTTTEAQTYSFRTEALALGTHVFRLKQVDLDGTAHYSESVEAVVELSERFVLKQAYPNPFHSEATVEFAVQEAEPVTVELYDALGQRVGVLYEGAPEAGQKQKVTVEGEGLASGLYFVRLSGRSFSETQSLVLVK